MLSVVIDRSFIIKEVNDRFVKECGSVREDIIGRTCYEITHKVSEPCSSSDHRCPVREVFNTGKAARVEHIHRDRSGGELIVELYVFPLLGEDGKIEHVVELSHNITERKRAEEENKGLQAQLIQAQKIEAIGTLAGGIAHDFNNLLAIIQGNVSLMLFDVDAKQPHYENLKRIEKQIQHGSKLTHQILAYARKGTHDVKPINLNELVAESSEAFGRTRKDTTIYRELTEDLYAIEVDQGQIEQVLLNLYVNATHAMPGGGDLILKTMNVTHDDMKDKMYDPKPGKYVLLTVTDTGTGMDKETQARIFDPFFTTKEMGGNRGTGLGLASVYGIVKAHAGYIDVESEKGKGTTFSIYLPATEKKVEKSVEAAGQIIEGSGTILLVDDEELVLEVGSEVLKKLGYTVLEAKGGKEALKIYRENNTIDLVILDMIMPQMGGGETYDKMKDINPDVKVVLSSGYGIDGQANEILARGCDGFIQKPLHTKELSEKIWEILCKR
jgi:PAS domain S-box-containing protein